MISCSDLLEIAYFADKSSCSYDSEANPEAPDKTTSIRKIEQRQTDNLEGSKVTRCGQFLDQKAFKGIRLVREGMNRKMHTGGKDKTKRIPIGTIQPNLRLKIKLARVSINDRTAVSIGNGCKNSIGFLW